MLSFLRRHWIIFTFALGFLLLTAAASVMLHLHYVRMYALPTYSELEMQLGDVVVEATKVWDVTRCNELGEAVEYLTCDMRNAKCPDPRAQRPYELEIATRDLRSDCIEEFAIFHSDVTACQQLPMDTAKELERMNECVVTVAEKTEDASACDATTSVDWADRCRAHVLKDVTYCYAVDDEIGERTVMKDDTSLCVRNYVYHTGDYVACEDVAPIAPREYNACIMLGAYWQRKDASVAEYEAICALLVDDESTDRDIAADCREKQFGGWLNTNRYWK